MLYHRLIRSFEFLVSGSEKLCFCHWKSTEFKEIQWRLLRESELCQRVWIGNSLLQLVSPVFCGQIIMLVFGVFMHFLLRENWIFISDIISFYFYFLLLTGWRGNSKNWNTNKGKVQMRVSTLNALKKLRMDCAWWDLPSPSIPRMILEQTK